LKDRKKELISNAQRLMDKYSTDKDEIVIDVEESYHKIRGVIWTITFKSGNSSWAYGKFISDLYKSGILNLKGC